MKKITDKHIEQMQEIYYCLSCMALEEEDCVCDFDYDDFLFDSKDDLIAEGYNGEI